MHVEKKTLRASGHVGPTHRRRRTLADGNIRGCLTKLNRNLAAIGKPRNVQSHGCRRRRRDARGLTSPACILSTKQEGYGKTNYRKKKQSHGFILARFAFPTRERLDDKAEVLLFAAFLT